MAIFDSTKKQYLTYNVVLTDAARVAELQAANPTGYFHAITAAETAFAAPFRGYTEPAAGTAPFIWTPWSGFGEEDGPYPIDERTFERHTGGFLGIGGTTVRYYWQGQFLLGAATTSSTVPPAEEANIPKRRWAEGFEVPGVSSSPTLAGGFGQTRDASRHNGGFGFSIRGGTNNYTEHTLTEYDATNLSARSWERFYVRVRRLPTMAHLFWRNNGTPSTGVGHALAIDASGRLLIFFASGGTFTLATTLTHEPFVAWDGNPSTSAWHKIDLLLDTGDTSPAIAQSLRVYVDGTLAGTHTGSVGNDLHTGSRIGNMTTDQTELELDVDDWINAEIPSRTISGAAAEKLNGKDWLNGTKIVALKATGFGTGHGAWVGDYRLTRQLNGGLGANTNEVLTSSTSGAALQINTDSSILVDGDPGAIGVASVGAHVFGIRGATATASNLGVGLAGAAVVGLPVTLPLVPGGKSAFFTNQTTAGEGGAAPVLADVTPIVVQFAHAANAEAWQVSTLMGTAEMIGKWGREDLLAAEAEGMTDFPIAGGVGTHNAPYPRAPWSQVGKAPPIAPYIVVGGTYVGNGTGQDVTFRAPVAFFFVRPLTANAGGYMLWAPWQGSHRSFQESVAAQIEFEQEYSYDGGAGADVQTQRYLVRIAGANTQSNANAVTYQYIAVCDPGMRFLLMGAVGHRSALASAVNRLVAPGFTPDFGLFFAGNHGNATTQRFYAKGPGQAADSFAMWAPGTLANAVGGWPTAGQLETRAGYHGAAVNAQELSYALWRRADGLQDTGQAGVANYGSYIGDGSASRTVNLAPAATRRPMFVMVFGQSGSSYWRDPSHTGSNSSNQAGTEATTGITSGGVDQFSVGSALNTNAVVYTYFVLYAIKDCTGNNGWGCNGEMVPVEPTSPGPGGPYPPEPPEPGPEEVPGGGGGPTPGGPGFPGGPPTNPTDFSLECRAWSTYLVNLALSRIGISRQIQDVTTDVSEEAFKARLVYANDVERTLRDFPWPFATRYAHLALVAGTAAVPVNKDWQYAYRAPADMVMARRIVSQDVKRRGWDPDPPQFRLGSDATGILIYTNAVADPIVLPALVSARPVELEYTVRMTCPAQQGDALFRDALIWKLAASLAQSLARDSKKAGECEGLYRDVLESAKVTAANEEQKDNSGGDAPWIAGR